ncbi:MAG: Xylose isomerase domain protein barrel [Akkermansiaceae bacterium]|nr:Xylose isomerase domain protein barrel [Akkermansiaceae bacterium]
MKLTGFADEAGRDLATQIRATRELGWSAISARAIDGVNLHELPQARFEEVADQLDAAGIQVPEFGSIIANWGKKIGSDFEITLTEIDRAIPRMQRLGTPLIRIMSYAQEPWGEDQQEKERFRRLRIIVDRFAEAGLTAAHENCMNWGGFSPAHTLRLLEEVPGLKLIFDTGNPVFQRDRSKPAPAPWQDPWEFWTAVSEEVVHIHVKDCISPALDGVEPIYTMPGEGYGRIAEILADAKAGGSEGWVAIEPHVATVFHVKDQSQVDWQQSYDSYVEYGRRMEGILAGLP